jgi:HSP20 family protein
MYRRYYRTPSVWQELDRLQREMNSLFEHRPRAAAGYPAMNIWADDESAIITTEVPGVQPEDIDISILNRTLTLKGSRTPDEVGENVRYHRQERGYGKFARTVQLPFRVDAEQVQASFKNGVLEIKLPRAEADKPRKIEVKSA